jgi:hypothetical protein
MLLDAGDERADGSLEAWFGEAAVANEEPGAA